MGRTNETIPAMKTLDPGFHASGVQEAHGELI